MLEGSWAPYRTMVTVTKGVADHGPHKQLQCVHVLRWDASIELLDTHKAMRQPLLDDAAPTGALQLSASRGYQVTLVPPGFTHSHRAIVKCRHVCCLPHQDNDRCLGKRALAAPLDDGDCCEPSGGGHLTIAVLLPLKLD